MDCTHVNFLALIRMIVLCVASEEAGSWMCGNSLCCLSTFSKYKVTEMKGKHKPSGEVNYWQLPSEASTWEIQCLPNLLGDGAAKPPPCLRIPTFQRISVLFSLLSQGRKGSLALLFLYNLMTHSKILSPVSQAHTSLYL